MATAYGAPTDRWTRNCGSGGIGHSGAVNDYRPGVLIHNHVEDIFKATGNPGETILTHTGTWRGVPNTTHRTFFTDAGKTGADLVEISERHDMHKPGIKADVLTRHGRFDEPPVQCLGTTYNLVHGRADGSDRRVQSYLWAGRKQNDLYVPTGTIGSDTARSTGALGLTGRKQQDWSTQSGTDPYSTTQRATSLPPAMAVAESPSRTQSLRPTADSGMLQQPGQRPKGPACEELDKNYRRTGLRVNYRT